MRLFGCGWCIFYQGIRVNLCPQNIHRNVEQNRPRTPRLSQPRGLFERKLNIAGICNLPRQFRDWPDNAHNVRLLKAALSDLHRAARLVGGDLPGDVDHGDRVEPGRGNPGYQVGRAGSRRGDCTPQPGETGVTVRRHCRGLLVLGTDVFYVCPPVEGVKQRRDKSSLNSKNRCNSLIYQVVKNIS